MKTELQTDQLNHWKEKFYEKYSTITGKKVTSASYQKYTPYGKHIIKKCLPSDRGIRILDMGCGIGGYLKVFYDAGYKNIEGIDLSDEDVGYAHAHGIIQVRKGDLFKTLCEANNEMYDVILFIDVIEHFTHEDILRIISETSRILKKSGSVIIHVPNAEGIFGSRVRYSDFTHEMAFTSNSLTQILRYAGFSSFRCFEDRPIVHNVSSFFRRMIWDIGTLPIRLLFAAETGLFSPKLSQNILFMAIK